MKTIAIYSRKSKFTGKGDSIENQIQLCKDFAKNIYPDSKFILYEDEGFSAKNTDRPKFQEMMNDAKSKKFNVLICYRLDRISRNVGDFSNLVDKLQILGIDFISIREQFDTSTPMGRAMMYISSVFAQLERETIAQRVSDNMLEMAKTGRWLGGQTPLGFDSKSISYFDSNMKERKMYKLAPNNNELKTVKLIYSKYLETKSLSQTAKFLTQNCIKTKLNKDIWHKKTIQVILNNPVYVKANIDVVNHMKSLGITVLGNPNNKNGLLTYNKKHGVKNIKDIKEWIAAVSMHKGIILASDWLNVQKILESNKSKAPRIGKTNTVLLTGILKCYKCGSNMKVIHSKSSNGDKLYYYKCTLKDSTSSVRCTNSNIRSSIIEEAVITNIESWSQNTNLILPLINKHNKSISLINKDNIINNMKKDIINKEKYIEGLIKQISGDETISKYISKEIKRVDKEILSLQTKMQNNTLSEPSFEKLNTSLLLSSFEKISIIKSLPFSKKQLLLSNILDSVYWNGTTKSIIINIHGTNKI